MSPPLVKEGDRIEPGERFATIATSTKVSIFASIGVAQPKDEKMYGYLSEHHSFGQDEEAASDFSEDFNYALDDKHVYKRLHTF